jgi:pyridinium-3,5-biscarboxylic acid mononucleotide sulfurtransferase
MLKNKYDKLTEYLKSAGKFAIAVSGGLDSMFLAKVAAQVCPQNFVVISVSTPYMHKDELESARTEFQKTSVKLHVLKVDFLDAIRNNPENRCYLCKSELFRQIQKHAASLGYPQVFDGTNADDIHFHRPGLKALKELKIKSPLLEAGITKNEVRELARKLLFSFAEKDSNSCLLTRLPYNSLVRNKDLGIVWEAENYLKTLGFRKVRLRLNDDIAQIEVAPSQLSQLQEIEILLQIEQRFKGIGIRKFSVNPEGYIAGKIK